MIRQDDRVQQLLELDAEITAAMQRHPISEREIRIWESRDQDIDADALFGNASVDAVRAILQLREQREVLARQIDALPDLE